MIAPPLEPGTRVETGGATALVAGPQEAAAMAEALGMTPSAADRAAAEGVLTGFTVACRGGDPQDFLCRIDPGTATAELHLSPRGAEPDCAVAGPLAAVAARLLERRPELRRVGVTVPDGHPVGAALVGAGFVDEGWAPPVRGTGASRMFTRLRA